MVDERVLCLWMEDLGSWKSSLFATSTIKLGLPFSTMWMSASAKKSDCYGVLRSLRLRKVKVAG